MSDVEEMIAAACQNTGPLVGYPDVIEVLLTVGLPLETLAALRVGAWKAVPVKMTPPMFDAWWEDDWAAMLAAAPTKPGAEF